MAEKIRLGFVGANVNSTWASQSHFPALLASPDVEFTAVCTRPESAEEARQAFGAKLAFHDFGRWQCRRRSTRWPWLCGCQSHYEATKAAIEAGKHVFTEWPLGRDTAEAEELATLARSKGVQTAVGLQSRASPALLFVKEQIEAGYVGEVLSCSVTTMRDGALERPSSRTWQRDASLGAHTLSIANGHVSTPCASWPATSPGWRAWSAPRPSNGTRPIPGSMWKSHRRTMCEQRTVGERSGSVGPCWSCSLAAAASGWRSTGGKARW